MPNQEMLRSAYAMYRAALRDQKCALTMVSVTCYRQADVLDTDQWYAAYAECNWRQFGNPGVVTAWSICEPQWLCQEQKPTVLSKVRTRSIWWLTFPNITWANSDDSLCSDSTCQSESQTNITVESQQSQIQCGISKNSHSEIQDILLLSQKGNWQLLGSRTHQQSNIFSLNERAMSKQSGLTDKLKPAES
jgi:hypothetical protein